MHRWLFVCCLLPALGWAQESRGSIRGKVTDPSGAPAPGVQIEVTNLETNVTIRAATNEDGNYEAPYLLPGAYRVTAELAGFKKSARDGVQVRVNDRITLDFMLEIGSVADSVVVTGDAPLIDAASASVGSVIDSRRVTELPIAGGNAWHLIRFVAGVRTPGHGPGNPTMDLIGTMAINGTRTGNSEALVDGVPNMSQGASTYMAPPQDMVEQFRVQTATYDASAGRAAGAVVTLTTKSGGNTPRGTAYLLHSPIRAVPWFSNRWLYDPTTGPITPEKRLIANPPWRYQRWGSTLSGPVVLPRLYDGRNQTFWSAGYEGMQVRRQQSVSGTFPTLAQRRGDFSELLREGIQIYDPLSAQLNAAGRTVRQPFPGNLIPSQRIDPIGAKILGYYPEPNTAGDRTGNNNYVRAQDQLWKYRSFATRVDHHFSDRWRAFARYGLSEFYQRNQDFPSVAFGTVNNPKGFRFALDNVYTFGPTALLNVRYGLVHQKPYSAPLSRGFDLASLGLPASLISMIKNAADYSGVAFPAITVTGHTSLGSAGGSLGSNYSHTIGGTFTKFRGNHSIRAGSEYRLYRDNAFAYGNVAPAYTFGNTYTRGPLDTSAGAPIGQGLASMLLGIPTGGQVDVNASRAEQSQFLSFFIQDDWRLTPKLTLNLGLRWEYNYPLTERFNRSIRSFAAGVAQPFEAQAQANYRANPIPEIPVASFAVKGGLTFAGVGGQPRRLWDGDRNNLMPRFGWAYQLTPKTVVRGGYGIFVVAGGADLDNAIQTGFSQSTTIIPSADNGLTFRATAANPFPEGIQLPSGSAKGITTFVGRSISFFNPGKRDGYMQRWSLNIQRELPGRTVVEAGYVGNRGTKLGTTRQIAGVLNEFLSTSPTRDQARIDYLNQQVPNPYFGIPDFAGTTLGSQRIARSQLLRNYSHFTGASYSDNNGYSWYHGMTLTVEKRFSHGLLFQSNWTWSKFMEAVSYLNSSDPLPAESVSDLDATHRFALNVIYELPVGRKRRFLGSAPRWLDALVGGWQIQGSYEGQSGSPLGFGNAIFNGNLADIPLPNSRRTAERWFNTEAGFERRAAFQLASNVRTFPLRFSGVRSDGVNNLDASFAKRFRITERVAAQFRLEGINAFNHVQFAAPNTTVTSTAFGSINAEYGHGQRQVNFVFKVEF